ncbi:MAG: DUF3024 domain-containing protein [Bacteroidota bacterium]
MNRLINQHQNLQKELENFLEKRRPPVEMRNQVDIGFSFVSQVVEIFEIRPHFKDEDKILNIPIAKSRYIKSRGIWKIYWRRGNGKWEAYDPQFEVSSLSDFLKIVDEDEHYCFWG